MRKILLCLLLVAGACAQAAPKAAAPQAAAPRATAEAEAQRSARRADIDFWLGGYYGEQLRSGKFQCRSPRFPQHSTQNDEINAIAARMDAWRSCYNGFVDNMNAQPKGEAMVPQDVLALMTPAERAQAAAHIAAVHAEIAQSAGVKAKIIMADFEAWRAATEAYVKEHNEVTRRALENDSGPDAELRRNNYAPKGN